MGTERSGTRLKRDLAVILAEDDFESAIHRLGESPVKKTVNILVSFLCHLDERVRWRSVSALGLLVAAMAEKSPLPVLMSH